MTLGEYIEALIQIRRVFGARIPVGRVSMSIDCDGESAFDPPEHPSVVEVQVEQPDGTHKAVEAVAL